MSRPQDQAVRSVTLPEPLLLRLIGHTQQRGEVGTAHCDAEEGFAFCRTTTAAQLRAQADALEAQAAAYLDELTSTPPTRGGPWHPLKQLHGVLRQEATVLRERAAWTAELERCRAEAGAGA
ncbi:hypothetical protein GO986_17845 [Deinococcus sp. HMF7620]|uniref:Uncharacterized protein n=1 Tax=Deinococcus arboris TaxID=2682977 RepID=A0A7C9M3Z0_9DEIO|nr:hypothetical protein [Deinococcus arboris]MVN88602.1 hypothetical protein [Deinococcus arboris]